MSAAVVVAHDIHALTQLLIIPGEIPASLGQLSSLESLRINRNRLSGQ